MTLDELERLGQLVCASDGRTFGKADATIWAAVVSDLPYGDCEAAVVEHAREGAGWLTPAMVRSGALRLGRIRAGLERQTQLGGPAGFCGVPGCECRPPTQAEVPARRRSAAELAATIAPVFRRVPDLPVGEPDPGGMHGAYGADDALVVRE